MRNHLDLVFVPVVLNQLVFHETAWDHKPVNALLIGSHPLMSVCFCGQNERRSPSSVVTSFGYDMPKTPAMAALANLSVGDHVVTGTYQFEVVQVVHNWNSLGLQLPKN